MRQAPEEQPPTPGFWRSRHALVVIGAVAAYFLLTEHLAHVLGALPYLLLLACPLMHLFTHRGQGHRGAGQGQAGTGRALMNHDTPAYGLWTLVVLNSAVFILFAFSFFKPATARDWRSFGAFSTFIVALFVEMYGFPLTLMFPVLLFMYGRLAITEETEMRAQFGEEFERYARRTPRFFPQWGQETSTG